MTAANQSLILQNDYPAGSGSDQRLVHRWGMGGHQGVMLKDEWLTPPEILRALGPFDLDPCSPIARPWPTAAVHYTIADDGLSREWIGRVWLNPPYGPHTGVWLEKLACHGTGTALIFARTETEAWHQWVWPIASSILFLAGRINFHHVSGSRAQKNAGAPSALISYGAIDAETLKTCGIPGKWIPLNNDFPKPTSL